jgi:non-ribosomal peptide synthetase component F
VVGTDVANRGLPETEGLIGFFVNQLVLRTNLSGNPSFLEVMKRVREVSLEAYTHQELPFDYLVKALNPERNLSHTPLFQIKFVLQNETLQDLKATFTVKSLELEPGTSKFDILLDMMESHEGLFLRLEYRTDLFSAEKMTQFLHQFEQVIRQMVASPETRLDDIQLLLATAERDELAKRKQKLRQLDLQKLERVRRERNLNKPRVRQGEEIS